MSVRILSLRTTREQILLSKLSNLVICRLCIKIACREVGCRWYFKFVLFYLFIQFIHNTQCPLEGVVEEQKLREPSVRQEFVWVVADSKHEVAKAQNDEGK